MRYANVHQFSADVPETKHDGHNVTVIRALTADECDIAEVGAMQLVRCEVDGQEFDVFPEELIGGN